MNKDSLQKILDMAGDDEFRDLVEGAADTIDKAKHIADGVKNPAEKQARAKELLEDCPEALQEKARAEAPGGIALILNGGGGKGCYQVGVYRALTKGGPFPKGIYTEVSAEESGSFAAGKSGRGAAADYDASFRALMAKYDDPVYDLMAKDDAYTEVASSDTEPAPAGGTASADGDAKRTALLPEGAIRAFAGTSIGALNAALFAGGDVETAEKLWHGIVQEELFDMRDLYAPDEENDRYLEGLLRCSGATEKINADAPLTTVTVFDRQTGYPKDVLLNSLTPEQQIRYLLASAAFPVVFSKQSIDGHDYVDGGMPLFGSNMPVAPMYALGFRRFIVVHTESPSEGSDRTLLEKWNAELNQEKYFGGSVFVHLYPSQDMGRMRGTMKFTQDYIEEKMRLGFTDAEAAAGDLQALCRDLPDELTEIHIRGGRRYRNYAELLEDLG